MNPRFVRGRARIALLATASGGRPGPIRGSYRPNHKFFGSDDRDMSVGFIELADGEVMHPGESRDLELTLSVWPSLEPELRAGRQWRIQEGARLVGTGTILKVLA